MLLGLGGQQRCLRPGPYATAATGSCQFSQQWVAEVEEEEATVLGRSPGLRLLFLMSRWFGSLLWTQGCFCEE